MPDPVVEQPTTGQDPQPVAAAPAPPVVGSGPWANDITSRFSDPGVASQVDAFLRERVQPYTTQLEQKASQAEQATSLWNSFNTDAIGTYVQVTTELFGEEAANKVLTDLQSVLDQGQQAPTSTPQEANQNLDPRVAQAVEFYENQQNLQAYEAEMARIKNEHPEVQDQFFHPFVATAGGDFNEAYRLYNNFVSQWGQAQEPTQAPVQEVAPQAFGSDTATQQPSNTPVQPRSQSIGEAIEEFVRESRQSAAPPMGAV